MVEAALFHGEPATRAGNPGFARGSKPVAEVYTAARAVEWLIRLVLLYGKLQESQTKGIIDGYENKCHAISYSDVLCWRECLCCAQLAAAQCH